MNSIKSLYPIASALRKKVGECPSRRIHSYVRLLIGLSYVFALSNLCTASALQDRFLREYPDSSKTLSRVYSTIKISAVFEENKDAKSGSAFFECEYTGTDGSYSRIARKKNTPNNETPKPELISAAIYNPNCSFTLIKAGDSEPYSVSSWERGTAPDALKGAGILQRIRAKSNPVFAPYCYYEVPVSEFISLPTFQIMDVSSERRGEDSLVKVAWSAPLPTQERSGWFLFDPEKCWALRGFSSAIYAKGATNLVTKQCDIQYSGELNGVPIIHRVEHWTKDPKQSDTKLMLDVVSVKNVSWEPTPLEFYTPESFNIKIPAKSSDFRKYILLGNAIILFILALLVLRKRRSSVNL